MDPDTPIPSIEQDDPQDATSTVSATNAASTSSTRAIHTPHSLKQQIESPVNPQFPASSPLRSPRKTPRLQQSIPSTTSITSSPSRPRPPSEARNPDRRSSTPLLHNKKSATSLQSQREITPLRQSSIRRSSSTLASTSSRSSTPYMAASAAPATDNHQPITEASVAQNHFQQELEFHQSPELASRTAVFLHDSCYGHRYSRPRTSKALLSTIVERPERVLASVLGISAAYVRMGARYGNNPHAPRSDRVPTVAAGVPFKIRKTSRAVPLNSASVIHVHGQKWMEELQIMCDSAEGKLALNGKELVRPIGYGKDENGDPLPKLHDGDLYLCSESINALEGCLGGVCDGVDAIFGPGDTRRAFVCIRPPGHHCSANYPSGFCWINNVHVGIAHAAMTHGLTHAAIIDFDLHHGDGSQTITWDHNRRAITLPKNAAPYKKTPIGYFSLHDINSYPCEMGDEEKVRNASLCIENAHGQSIWNVHLQPWKSEEEFWHLYETRYSILLDKTRTFLAHHTSKLASSGSQPRAAIFLSAGFDASEWEGQGMQRHKVNVPTSFYARFTADVVRLAEEEGLGVDGRILSVLEGGYSDRALTSGVLSHVCGLVQEEANHLSRIATSGQRPAGEFESILGAASMDSGKNGATDRDLSYDADWWAATQLEALEMLVDPSMNSAANKTKNEKPSATYSSPTQASTARMNEQAKERRSLSAQLERRLLIGSEPPVAIPAVDWAVAAHQMSRILIPSDRQTLSCRYDELNAEATRVRRERQSTIGLPAIADQKMQLRDRKVKMSALEEVPARPPSRGSNRRKTIAAVADLPDPGMSGVDSLSDGGNVAGGRPRRRSSGASSIVSGFKGMKLGDPAEDLVTSRASSLMPENSQKPLPVKKVRNVAVPKAQPAKITKPRASSPKKALAGAPAVPRVPSAFKAQIAGAGSLSTDKEVTTDEKISSHAASESTQKVAEVEDLDKLSSGLKKMTIKLKVPSPEENTAREKKVADEKLKKAKAARKPALPKVPRVPKTATTKLPAAQIDVSSTERPAPSTIDPPVLHSGGLSNVSEMPVETPGAVSEPMDGKLQDFISPAIESKQQDRTEEIPVATVDIPPTYEYVMTNGFEQGAPISNNGAKSPKLDAAPFGGTIEPTQAIRDEPITSENEAAPIVEAQPNVEPSAVFSSPSSRKTKADLPVFTSSSPIPFSKSKMSRPFEDVKSQQSENFFARPPSASSNLQFLTGPTNGENPTLNSDETVKIGVKENVEDAQMSIWDVPETPKH